MGDMESLLKEQYRLVWSKYHDIDILFGACRTKGKTVDFVKEQAKEHKYKIIWTSTYSRHKKEKKIDEYQMKLNERRAQELFSYIENPLYPDKYSNSCE